MGHIACKGIVMTVSITVTKKYMTILFLLRGDSSCGLGFLLNAFCQADGTGGVTILANLATWRISAQ